MVFIMVLIFHLPTAASVMDTVDLYSVIIPPSFSLTGLQFFQELLLPPAATSLQAAEAGCTAILQSGADWSILLMIGSRWSM
jgi:hypothetical protein